MVQIRNDILFSVDFMLFSASVCVSISIDRGDSFDCLHNSSEPRVYLCVCVGVDDDSGAWLRPLGLGVHSGAPWWSVISVLWRVQTATHWCSSQARHSRGNSRHILLLVVINTWQNSFLFDFYLMCFLSITVFLSLPSRSMDRFRPSIGCAMLTCKNRRENDLLCVAWDVTHYSLARVL